MKVNVFEQGEQLFALRLPNFMLWSALIEYPKKYADVTLFENVSRKGMKKSKEVLKRMKKLHGEWSIVEVVTNDGTVVDIKV